MTDVAVLIADMVRAGVDPDLIGRAAAALAEREPVQIIDEQAARRRAKDRERKRLRNSAESAEGGDKKEAVSPRPPSEEKILPPSPPKGGSSPKRGSRLPVDWVLPDEWRAFATEQGLAEADVDLEAAKFMDHFHARAGPNGVKLDWFATWRNWIRNAEKYQPKPRVAKQSPHDKAFAGFAAAARDGP